MNAGKAYITSLGTTGLLIASSLLLLTVVGTIVAFDRWPAGSPYGSETVAIGGAGDARPAGGAAAGSRRARAERRRAVAERRAVARTRARGRTAAARRDDGAGTTPSVADPVVSDLPAPQTDPGVGGTPGGGSGSADVGSRSAGPEGRPTGGGPDGAVGDAVSQVGPPQTGSAVDQVGQAVQEAVAGPAPALAP